MNDTTKTLLGLAARRAFTAAGVWLVSKGLIQGDPSGFVGACMVLAEVLYEGWNRYGMVLVDAQLAKIKGVHPSQNPTSPSPPMAPAAKAVVAFFAVMLASLNFVLPAMAATKKTTASSTVACADLLNLLPPGCTPSANGTASPATAINNLLIQIQKTDNTIVSGVVTALQEADADAGTVVIPATATAPATVKDPIAHACYPAQEQYLQSLPTAQPIKSAAPYNLIVLFQYKRDFINLLLSGNLIPAYLKVGCASLLGNEAAVFAGTLGLIGVGSTMLGPITAFATGLGASVVSLMPVLAF